MHLESLKVFCDVVRHHSFSRGAVANDVSQSAASQIVQQLEKRLDVKLIDRSRRPWVLTREGQIYYEGCQELIERYHEIEASLRQQGEQPAYTVRVAAIYSIGFQCLRDARAEFRERWPKSDVHFDFEHPDRVYDRVQKDEADIGIVSFPQRGRDWKITPWHDQPMALCCSPHFPLSQVNEPIGWDDLQGQRWIAFAKSLPIRREVDRYLKKHRVEVEVVTELDNLDTVKEATEDALGVTMLPRATFYREVERGLLKAIDLPASDPMVRPLGIITRRRRPLPTAVDRFIEVLLDSVAGSPPPQASEADDADDAEVNRDDADDHAHNGSPRSSGPKSRPGSARESEEAVSTGTER